MTGPKLIFSGFFLALSLLRAQEPARQAQLSSIAAQLGSVRQQSLSLEVQRQSVVKQEASVHRMPKQTAFLEPLQVDAPYVDCDALAPRETDRLIATAARTQSVSADLLRAVIRQESAFRPCAVSEKGAQGLMQLMPATAAAYNVSDPFDPQQNILAGAAYLRQLMQRYAGDASRALSAYNAGPQRVDPIEGIPDIPETQNYVSSIFRDLGWTLPARPSMPPDTGLEQDAPVTDAATDATEQAIPAAQATPEANVEPPIKDKAGSPAPPLL
ncbi:MAG: lytic transglycosylase domain-containing protein [Bryobacteraceae bacterium]